MKQYNFYADSTAVRHFMNVFPTANITWRMSSAGSMGLTYSGKTQQPSFNQLQPIQNNNDPLNIQIGNPNLKPAFYHSVEGQFNVYKAVTSRVIRGYAALSLADRDFSSTSAIDNLGRRTYQTININGNYNYNASLTYGRSIDVLHINVSVNPSVWGARYTNYINGKRNETKVFSFSPTVYINNYIANVIDIQSFYNIDFRRTTSSINPQAPTTYQVQTVWFYMGILAIKDWKISTSVSYNVRSKLSANDANTNAMIWNIAVERKIIPKANINAVLRINDVFNQNIGFNRSINSTSITESTYETIRRYVMLSLSWKFNKNRGAQQ